MRTTFRTARLVFCVGFLLLAFSLVNIGSLYALDYPTKPVNLVIPFGPGGYSDRAMRMLSPVVQEFLGQPLIIHYRPGASGSIGANEVAQAEPDGYTLLSAHPNCNTLLPAADGRGKGPGEMAAVCFINAAVGAFWTQPNAPFKNFKEMIAWAKANPGKLVYGNPGAGSAGDLYWRWLEMNVGFKSRNVPYTGGGALLAALLGGHVQVARLGNATALPNWRAGKIIPIFSSGNKRIPELPDVRCLLEEGYDLKGMGSSWIGILAPNGTPRPIIDKIALAFKKATEDKRAIDGMKKLGQEFGYLGPDDFEKQWKEEYLAYKELWKSIKKKK